MKSILGYISFLIIFFIFPEITVILALIFIGMLIHENLDRNKE